MKASPVNLRTIPLALATMSTYSDEVEVKMIVIIMMMMVVMMMMMMVIMMMMS
jgi:hypothetical protein